MDVIHGAKELRSRLDEARRSGKRVGLVPTMGFLHEGHLSLVRIAKERSDLVVVTIFVNPTQFGPNEDLDRYPRSLERDCQLCEAEGADIIYAPAVYAVYAPDHSVSLVENDLSAGLCGASRPVHFGGVLTIVAKLFNLTQPDIAVFGEKDAQQLRVIRRMVRDLDFAVEIVPGPTVREADGTAMSSRNANLSPEERLQAPLLFKSLDAAGTMVGAGERSAVAIRNRVLDVLAGAKLGEVDYVEVVDDETLKPVEQIERSVLVAVAVQFSAARLIDNRTLHV